MYYVEYAMCDILFQVAVIKSGSDRVSFHFCTDRTKPAVDRQVLVLVKIYDD